MNKDQIIKELRDMAKHPTVTLPRDCEALRAAADLLAQTEQDGQCKRCTDGCPVCEARRLPEQEPVAMKFKIYKPTVPDPTRQDINNALLPWVYDQDRSSGFDASMWVTPVSTLPPQHTWVGLTDEEIVDAHDVARVSFKRSQQGIRGQMITSRDSPDWHYAKAIEAKLKEKNGL